MSFARNRRLPTPPQMVPRGPVELDFAHPLARGLLSYILLADGIGRDLVGASGPLLYTAGATAQVGVRGGGVNFGNTGNVALPAPANPQVYTFEALIETAVASPNYDGAVVSYNGVAAGNGGTSDRTLRVADTYGCFFSVYNGTTQTVSDPNDLVPGVPYHLAATSTGALLTLYVDGEAVASLAAAGGASYPAFFCVGNGNALGSFNGIIHYAAQRNVALSAAEVAQLAAAPFAMLRPRFVPRRASLTGGSVVFTAPQVGWGYGGRSAALAAFASAPQRDVVWRPTAATLAADAAPPQRAWGWAGAAASMSAATTAVQRVWGWTAAGAAFSASARVTTAFWRWVGNPVGPIAASARRIVIGLLHEAIRRGHRGD